MMPYFFPDKYSEELSSMDNFDNSDSTNIVQETNIFSDTTDDTISTASKQNRRFGNLKPNTKRLLAFSHLRRNQESKNRKTLDDSRDISEPNDFNSSNINKNWFVSASFDQELVYWRRVHLLHRDPAVVVFDQSKSVRCLKLVTDWEAECHPFMEDDGLTSRPYERTDNDDSSIEVEIEPEDSVSVYSNELRRMSALDDQKIMDLMSERARRNIAFLYVKIPGFPIRLSYKGIKQKNVTDVTDFPLNISTLEYRARTWTWLDFALEMKSRIRRQLIKELLKKPFKFSRVFQRFSSKSSGRLSNTSFEKIVSGSGLENAIKEDDEDVELIESLKEIDSLSLLQSDTEEFSINQSGPSRSFQSANQNQSFSEEEQRYQSTMKMILGPLADDVRFN